MDVLQASSDYLTGKGIDPARLLSEQLMSHVLKCPRLQLYLRFETQLDESQLAPLRSGIRRLGAGEPLQYVVGDTDFMAHCFKTDPRALIPRPDTEVLVECVLKCEPLWMGARPVLADVGTGSGCIAISLALARPEASYIAIDLSPSALTLARENAALNKAGSIDFRVGDLLDGVEPSSLDAVVANLPYIATGDCQGLPRQIREHEPLTALDGGADGLVLIRRLVDEARTRLKAGGFLFLEIGFDQAGRVVEWLQQRGYVDISVVADLGGRDRLVQSRRPEGQDRAAGEGLRATPA
jgi:release factor glutamine methyltransferase